MCTTARDKKPRHTVTSRVKVLRCSPAQDRNALYSLGGDVELDHSSALQMGLALGWDWPVTLKAVYAVAAQVFEQDPNKQSSLVPLLETSFGLCLFTQGLPLQSVGFK